MLKLTKTRPTAQIALALLPLLAAPILGLAQSATPAKDLVLQFDAAQTDAHITLPTTLHIVEGAFAFKRGQIHYDPATGKASGEIVFDATSGKTGNSSRDSTMHKSVIESAHFTEITFHPDSVEGAVASSGSSSVKVHGMFGIHGAEHEVTMPVDFAVNGKAWTTSSSFQVPFVQWGMKDPSMLFLRVNKVVQVKFHAGGSVEQ